MINLPDPLTPPDCSLHEFPFMPLDVARLRDSDIAAIATGDEFRCAVLLWCASWHQVPAASLPKDDVVLANLAGFGRVVKEWMKVKEGSLRGWIHCSDGRLYHPVVAEKALIAWRSKLEQAYRTELARIKKYNQRHEDKQLEIPTLDEWLSQRQSANVPGDNIGMSPGQAANVPKDMQEMSQGQTQPVPAMSPGKQHPIERERDIERDTEREKENIKPGTAGEVLTSPAGKNSPNSQLSPGEICALLKAEHQIIDINPANPTLIALVNAGASAEEFKAAAIAAQSQGKAKFGWIIARVKGQRQDAANLQLHKGPMPSGNARDQGRQLAAESLLPMDQQPDPAEKDITPVGGQHAIAS